MKRIITQNFLKVLLIIAFIGLAFYQWKNEKVYSVESDAPAFEHISSVKDKPLNDELVAEEKLN